MAEKTAKTIENTENIEELSKEQLIELVKEQKVAHDRLLKRRSKLGLSFETPNNRKEMGRDTWDEHIATLLKQNIPYLTKREDKTILQNSEKPTHKLIKGDNFPALLTLYPEYKGKVDVIYIDPPYNTGNKDFIYNDRYVNTEDGYRHSMWLSFMARRLLLAQELLSETGVIFVSIDDNEQAYLKVLMDEIFGAGNTDAFIWNKEAEGKSGTLKQVLRFRSIHEYVLVGYANKSHTVFYKIREALSNGGELQTANLAVNRSQEKTEHKNYYPIVNAFGDTFLRQWKWDKEKIDRLISEELIYWGSDGRRQPRLVIPTDDRRETFLESILNYGGTTVGRKELEQILGEGAFSFPKPTLLLKKILGTSSMKDSIVLDFFAGSGTTGHAVAELNAEDGGNRRCILVTDAGKSGNSENSNMSGNNENAVDIAEDITYERMRRVLTGEDWANPAKAVALNQNLEMFEVSFLPKAEQGMRKTAFELKMDLEDVFVDLGVDEDLAEIYAERLYNRWEKFAENDKGDLEQWD